MKEPEARRHSHLIKFCLHKFKSLGSTLYWDKMIIMSLENAMFVKVY